MEDLDEVMLELRWEVGVDLMGRGLGVGGGEKSDS